MDAVVNTCALCLNTVMPDGTGTLRLVGEPFLPVLPHDHAVAA